MDILVFSISAGQFHLFWVSSVWEAFLGRPCWVGGQGRTLESPATPTEGLSSGWLLPFGKPYEVCCSSTNVTRLQEEMSLESIQVGCLIDPLTLRIPTTPPDSTLLRGAPLALILSGWAIVPLDQPTLALRWALTVQPAGSAADARQPACARASLQSASLALCGKGSGLKQNDGFNEIVPHFLLLETSGEGKTVNEALSASISCNPEVG